MARTVLITGCSSGIGLDMARTFQARGWRVLAACRRPADAERLAAEGLETLVLDYADPESVAQAVEETLARAGGRLDALVNNGAFAIPAPLEDIPREGMREIFETNFLGWHDLTRRLLPALRENRGRIVNVSSVLGFLSLRYRGAYNATKFAVEGWSDALRRELEGPESPAPGCRVLLVEPGPIRSAFRRNSLIASRRWAVREGSAWARAWDEKILPRLEAEESKTSAAFELGPEAVTAKVIHALEARRPRARYFVTTPTWVAAVAKMLPIRLQDRLFRGDH